MSSKFHRFLPGLGLATIVVLAPNPEIEEIRVTQGSYM